LRASGPGVVGAYAAADRLAQPVIGVSAAIVASALPLVSRAATSGDPHELAAIFRSSMRRAVTVLLPVVVAASALAPWAIRAIAPEYLHAVQPFRVLIVGTLFMFLNQLSSMFIVGIGRFRALMLVAFVNLAVYLALAARLVPTYGAVGSAIATTVMEAINCVMQLAVVAALLRARKPASEPAR
jgi:O-antigen/teichoic acid export membrane protein